MSNELYWTLICAGGSIAAGMFTYGFLEFIEYMKYRKYIINSFKN